MASDKIPMHEVVSARHPQKGLALYLNQELSFFGPLVPILVFYVLSLLMFFIFRTALFLTYLSRVVAIEDYFLLFPIGLRMDTIVLCYILIVPLLPLLIFPVRITRKISWIFSLYLTHIIASSVFLEIATFPFMAEFETRRAG